MNMWQIWLFCYIYAYKNAHCNHKSTCVMCNIYWSQCIQVSYRIGIGKVSDTNFQESIVSRYNSESISICTGRSSFVSVILVHFWYISGHNTAKKLLLPAVLIGMLLKNEYSPSLLWIYSNTIWSSFYFFWEYGLGMVLKVMLMHRKNVSVKYRDTISKCIGKKYRKYQYQYRILFFKKSIF